MLNKTKSLKIQQNIFDYIKVPSTTIVGLKREKSCPSRYTRIISIFLLNQITILSILPPLPQQHPNNIRFQNSTSNIHHYQITSDFNSVSIEAL